MKHNSLNWKTNSIAHRLLISIIICSSVITLLATSLQLYLEYNYGVDLIEKRIEQIRLSHEKGLAASLWGLDYAQILIQIEGILTLDDIVHAEIVDSDGKIFATIGKKPTKNAIFHSLPLYYKYQNQVREMGVLNISATLNSIYNQIIQRILIILATNSIKTFLVSGCILFVVQIILTRHLNDMAIQTRSFDLSNLDTPLKLARDNDAQDELSQVVNSFNGLRTKLKNSYKEIQESEEKYRSLFSVELDAIFLVEHNTSKIVDANQSALVMYGYSKEELFEISLESLNKKPDKKVPFSDFNHEFDYEAEEVTQKYKVHYQKNGTPFFVDVVSGSFLWNEKLMKYEVVRDISKRVIQELLLQKYNQTLEEKVHERTQELEEKNQQLITQEKMASLAVVTAGLAHEIKNPLNFIKNYAELSIQLVHELEDNLAKTNPALSNKSEEFHNLKNDIHHANNTITRNSERINNIIQNMLQHFRKGDGVWSSSDLNKLILDYLELSQHGLKMQYNMMSVSIEKDIHPDLPKLTVLTERLGRVFLNLYTNAFYALYQKAVKTEFKDYTPTLFIKTSLYQKNILEVIIRDNGTGISKEVLPKVFHPFYTTKPAEEGVGLGLSISHEIVVKEHKGTIAVDSKEGEYTQFIVRLPINQSYDI
ncbi:MAG: PAS domain S-box-containing protein [bacterium]|jgi:PAS domain S-box-containing protein